MYSPCIYVIVIYDIITIVLIFHNIYCCVFCLHRPTTSISLQYHHTTPIPTKNISSKK